MPPVAEPVASRQRLMPFAGSGVHPSTTPGTKLIPRSCSLPTSVQQPAMAVNTQVPAAQVSVVQASPLLQSASVAQHPGAASTTQVLLLSHEVVVHGFVSAQSASTAQQPGTGVATQLLFVHELDVQRSVSVHSASEVQHPAMAVELHAPEVQMSAVQAS